MISKPTLALTTAMALAMALAPTMVSAQEETAAAGGIETAFGTVVPVVAGAVAVGAIVGLAVVLSAQNNNNSTSTTAP